ncbi:MAG: leucine-rich repeat domain-containing protein [Spirochaetaceae bacterium]|jgi:hypothetical protein|nr:leucine-rich repeat domain-containing protein [Spirochaetaceae bacterium]
MKKNSFLFGMLAAVLSCGIVLAGCDRPPSERGSGGSGVVRAQAASNEWWSAADGSSGGNANTVKSDEPPPVAEEPKPSEPAPNEADFEVKQLADNTLEITKYTGNDASLVIPPYLYGLKVTKLGNSAFQDKKGITSVTVPNTVKEIGFQCFSSCRNLATVTLGDGVEVIGESAFSSCKKLTSVTLGKRVREIGIRAFHYCEKLAEITLPASLKKIDGEAFDNTALTVLDIPNGVTYINWGAFSNTPLTTLVIPPSLAKYGTGFARAFEGMGGGINSSGRLTCITLPANVDERNFQKASYSSAFNEAFVNFWKSQGKKGGTYVKNGPIWTLE